nr:MAG TPA: hypothetical protein [Caudoviricetes sp.]DAL97269.1 MAG TPA: hypothetical protein [Caudoviricetes sp.]
MRSSCTIKQARTSEDSIMLGANPDQRYYR